MEVKNDYLKLDIQLFADGEITYKVTLDSDGAIKSMEKIGKTADKTSKKADELANKFKSVGTKMTVGLTVPITAFGTYAVKMASDLNEVQNVVDTTFENSSETINKFAKSAAEQFGISELSAKQFTGTMGAMLKSMGLGNKDITDMSIALSGLAGDMASFYNLDPEEAFEKLRAGISGETEPLKQLGINMSVVNLEAFAMSKGITKSYDSMTQAEQATLRYQYIMETTADAQGDYSKTADSTANKTRTTMLQFQTLSAELGQQLLPIVNDVLGALQSVIKWFSNLDDNGKKVVLTIAGIAMAIGPLSLAIGTLIKVGTGISTVVSIIKSWNLATKAMTAAQWLLNAAMSANPITLMVLGIAALIAILVVCYNKFEWFRDGVNAIAQGIANFFINAWNLIYNTASSVWNGVLGLFSQGGRIFLGITEGIANFFKTVVNALLSGINKVIATPFNLINGTLNKIRNIEFLGISPFKGLWGQNPIRVPQIPMLNVGTNYVGKEGLAYLHEGEAVVPKKYNPAIGGYGNNYQPNITIIADMDVNKFGKAFVRDIKTFSGGAKNAYNYGGGK